MASTLFNGTSRFSNDFVQVIDRAVRIATLPMTQMQQQRVRASDESAALKIVEAKVLALQATLVGIGGTLDTNSWLTSSSDTNIVRVSSKEGVAAGSYSLQVNKLGVFSTAVSAVDPDPAKRIADPSVGSFVTPGSTQLTLTLKNWDTGATQVLDPVALSGQSLQGVVDTINQKFGADVKAAIVNLGSTSEPNFQLSVQSTKLGKIAIQVNDGTRDLMDVDLADNADASLGERAEYKINGALVKSDSRAITIAPKLTADLLQAQPGKDVTVTVEQSTTNFKNAFSSFINSFNSVMTELDTQAAGTLRGNSILSTIRQQLRAAMNAPLSDGFGAMANIGVEFTKEGKLSLNSPLFESATAGKLESLKNAIGSATTSGFLKVATDALNTVEGSKGEGILQSTIKTMEDSLKAQDSRIADQQDRIDQLTRDLEARMSAADALIAQLEQKASYFTNMFDAMRQNQKSYS